MPLDPAFVEDCPYGPEALLFEDLVEVDRAAGRVVARLAVHDELPLTRHQRVHPVKHPRHVNGGLMVHLTGMLGFAHAYYVLDLRHADGWIGYGARIHEARFLALAEPGAPMLLKLETLKSRKMRDAAIMARYRFEFRQNDKLVYESQQTAMWMKAGAELPAFFGAGE